MPPGTSRTGTSRWITFRARMKRAAIRDGTFACALCGLVLDPASPARLPSSPELDHIEPVSRGGAEFDPDNVQWLCLSCNRAKGARLPTDGDLVPSVREVYPREYSDEDRPVGFWHVVICRACPHPAGPDGQPWSSDQRYWDGRLWLTAPEVLAAR